MYLLRRYLFCIFFIVLFFICSVYAKKCERTNETSSAFICNGLTNMSDIEDPQKVTWRHLILEQCELNMLCASDLLPFVELTKIELVRCNIISLGCGTFSSLKLLKEIVFSDTQIENLPSDWLFRNNTLEKITITHNSNVNSDSFITSYLSQCAYLTHLDLPENEIERVYNGQFASFTNLIHLNLHQNNIQKIDENSFSLNPNLEYLDLSDNQIPSVSAKTVSGLRSLRTINLDQNNIKSLENHIFSQLRSLEEAIISGNSLEHIKKDTFRDISTLLKLRLDENDIRLVDPLAFASLPNLRELDLSRNNLDSLSPDIFIGLNALEQLHVDHNSIFTLQPQTFVHLTSVREIDLTSNRLTSISNEPFTAANGRLVKLSLALNNINVIQPGAFDLFPNLISLNLNRNQLPTIPANIFSRLSKLNILIISNNYLTSMENFVIPSLKSLNIADNKLSFLPPKWNLYRHLRSISLGGNPWQCACLDEIVLNLKRYQIDYVDSIYFNGKKQVCVVFENMCIRDVGKFTDSGKIYNYESKNTIGR